MSESSHVLDWQMYGPHTALAFSASLDANGYRVTLTREETVLFSGALDDSATLFRVSADIRERLQQLGYRPHSLPQTAPVLAGGPCWGPAAPIHSSLVSAALGRQLRM